MSRSTRASYRMPAWALVGMAVATLPSILVAMVLWVLPASLKAGDDRTAMAVRGFANMWFAGRMSTGSPSILTDFPAYTSAMRALFGGGFPEHSWGYPPSMLLLAAPFGALPLLGSFVIWSLLGIVAFGAALYAGRREGLPRLLAMACMLAPALWCCILSGQTGAMAGALLIGGMLLYPRSPRAAGIMLGLLSLKPQMGFLLPVHLFAAGRKRTLVWAGITAFALFGISTLVWGVDAWRDFLSLTGPRMTGILEREWTGSPAQADMTSPFMSARALGLPLWGAWTTQALVGVLCVAGCWKVSRLMSVHARAGAGHEARLVGIALVVGLDLLSVPYSHDYDMPAMAVAVAILFRDCLRRGNRGAWELPCLALAWTWPGAMVIWAAGNPGMSWISPLLGTASLLSVVLVGASRMVVSFEPVAPDNRSWTTGAMPVEHGGAVAGGNDEGK